MPNLTLIDVAKLAGVSRSTVSRVVNEDPNVSDDVRDRVLTVIHQTGYQPNMAARSLRTKSSNILGLVIPENVRTLYTDPFFLQLNQGTTQACNAHDKTLALFVESNEETLIPRVTRGGHLDGVVVQSGRANGRLIRALVAAKIPFVVAGRPHNTNGTSYVDIDNTSASYSATIHLVRLGYRRIATITGPLDEVAGMDRLIGYKRALQDRGLPIDEDLISPADFREIGAYIAAKRLIPHRPDAVFVASDLMARSAVRAFSEAGLRVPEDIALVGFDDLPPAVVEPPLLTTIRQPIIEFGYQAVEMLIDLIEHGQDIPRQILLSYELVIRDSCGAKLKGLAPGTGSAISNNSRSSQHVGL
jgi:LacI family transcriptional regulator